MPDFDCRNDFSCFWLWRFAASLGIIGSFSFSGFIVLMGVVLTICGYPDFQAVRAFGPCFGPHVFFAFRRCSNGVRCKKRKFTGWM